MSSKRRMFEAARSTLEEVLGEKARSVRAGQGIDGTLRFGHWSLALAVQASSSSAAVTTAARRLLAHGSSRGADAIPVVVVPYMGPAGRSACSELGVSWLDLSGNADLRGEGLVVHVEGRPNRFKSVGRPSSVFAPKASRVARVLLDAPNEAPTHGELVARTGLGGGYVSRTLQRLEAEGYVQRDAGSGRVRLRDAASTLRDWRAAYRFDKHEVRRGHVALTADEDLLTVLDEGLRLIGIRYAATGLAAAWLLAEFSGFRTATFFVERALTDEEAKKLSLRWTDKGANVWMVVPNDTGVFFGARPRSGAVPCVSPTQALLDLKAHPERAAEAMAAVEKRYLGSMPG